MNDGTRTHDNRDHNPGLYQLSYAHHILYAYGTPGRIRTCYPRLRRPMLYPNELRAQILMVGVERFELPTSCSQSRRATRLRYTPLHPSQGQRLNNTTPNSFGQEDFYEVFYFFLKYSIHKFSFSIYLLISIHSFFFFCYDGTN